MIIIIIVVVVVDVVVVVVVVVVGALELLHDLGEAVGGLGYIICYCIVICYIIVCYSIL